LKRKQKQQEGAIMFQLINNIISGFRKKVKRKKTWEWFLVIIIGMMVGNVRQGLTKVISSLRLMPEKYHAMVHFFRSKAYSIREIYAEWVKTAKERAGLERIGGRIMLIGDHLKMSKEGKRMPMVGVMHSDSGNNGKSAYTEGHLIGQVSGVARKGTECRSLPLMSEVQCAPGRKSGKRETDGDSTVTQMVNLGVRAAQATGEKCVIALDAYFAKETAFRAAAAARAEDGSQLMEIVTRAPINTVGYEKPEPPEKNRRGAPRKYGKEVKLYSKFADMSEFMETEMTLYGRKTKVRYNHYDLMWKPIEISRKNEPDVDKRIRFVLVETDGNSSERCVLMSSSRDMTPEQIISAYGLRFKIESSFNEQKNEVGCFSYRFWSKAIPKKKKWKKLETPPDPAAAAKVDDAKHAIDAYICLATIATGILTIIAFSYDRFIWRRYSGWLRTVNSSIPSISVVREVIASDFPLFLRRHPFFPLCSIISSRQRIDDFLYDFPDSDLFDLA
jgi:hypothetical protein